MRTRSWRAALAGMVLGVAAVASAPPAGAAAGPLDPTFGSGGVAVSPALAGVPVDLLVRPDGALLAVTSFGDDPNATQVFGVQRFGASGALDPTFGVGGRATASFTNFISTPADGALQADGKIVVVGTSSEAQGADKGFVLARFTTDGALDPTFGAGGKVVTPVVGPDFAANSRSPATAVVIQPDGKILVGGSARGCAKARCPVFTALVRYNPDGSPDAGFGAGGIVMALAVGQVSGLALTASGTIVVVAGTSVAEFGPTGVLQPTVTHTAVTATSSRGFQTTPVVFQADGRYTVEQGVARVSSPYRNDIDSQVSRFRAGGSADPTFTSAPFAFSDDGARGNDRAQAITRRANGQIVTGGYRSPATGEGSQFAVARLTATGQLDPAFATGGKLIVPLPGGGYVSALAEQPDGKVVVAGLAFTAGSFDARIVLVRLVA